MSETTYLYMFASMDIFGGGSAREQPSLDTTNASRSSSDIILSVNQLS